MYLHTRGQNTHTHKNQKDYNLCAEEVINTDQHPEIEMSLKEVSEMFRNCLHKNFGNNHTIKQSKQSTMVFTPILNAILPGALHYFVFIKSHTHTKKELLKSTLQITPKE